MMSRSTKTSEYFHISAIHSTIGIRRFALQIGNPYSTFDAVSRITISDVNGIRTSISVSDNQTGGYFYQEVTLKENELVTGFNLEIYDVDIDNSRGESYSIAVNNMAAHPKLLEPLLSVRNYSPVTIGSVVKGWQIQPPDIVYTDIKTGERHGLIFPHVPILQAASGDSSTKQYKFPGKHGEHVSWLAFTVTDNEK
jgi:hypothetical protein